MLDHVLGHHKSSYQNRPFTCSKTSNPKWDRAIFDINGEALEHVPIIRVAVIPVAHHLVIDELLVKTHLQFL